MLGGELIKRFQLRDDLRIRLAIWLQHGVTVPIGDWGFHGFVELSTIEVETYPEQFLKTLSFFPKRFLVLPTEPSDPSGNDRFLFDTE